MYDLIIIGGGAAGLFLAANMKGKRVLLLEKMKETGKKILLSGGGMCNLTNCDSTDEFLTRFGNKKQINFIKPALLNLPTEKTRQWFEKNGLPLIIRDDGKVFPSSLKANSVIDVLLSMARKNNVEIKTSQNVIQINNDDGKFTVLTETDRFESTNAVITTGGKSYETTGSDGSGYILAKSLGHKILEPTQGLVAVHVDHYSFSRLAGISIKGSSVDFFHSGEDKKYKTAIGDLLFTHKGISGPVILNNSRDIKKNDLLLVSLIPTENKEKSRIELLSSLTNEPKKQIKNVLKSFSAVTSLSESILSEINIDRDEKCSVLKKNSRNKLITMILDYPFVISRKGYFSSAMITVGGIDLDEVNRKTMESKLVKNLYFAGEVLDIDGDSGGYNIQAAFSTAYLIASTLL